MLFNGTVHTSNKFSNLLLNLCPTMCPCFSIEPFTLDTSSATSSATVAELVRQHVASVKAPLAAFLLSSSSSFPSSFLSHTSRTVSADCFRRLIKALIGNSMLEVKRTIGHHRYVSVELPSFSGMYRVAVVQTVMIVRLVHLTV